MPADAVRCRAMTPVFRPNGKGRRGFLRAGPSEIVRARAAHAAASDIDSDSFFISSR